MEELQRSGGPSTAVAARNDAGFTSLEGLLVERPAGGTSSTGIVPDLRGHTVQPGDVLSWVWFPERTLPGGLDEPDEAALEHFWDATAFALDVVFTDGSRLSGTSATDQYGAAVTPGAQADAKTLWVDQWNRRAVDLADVVGRTVDHVEATIGRADDDGAPVGQAQGGGAAAPALRGWLDDVRVEAGPRRASRPVDRVVTTRGTQASGRFSRGNDAPLVAVPHGGVFGLPMTDASSQKWPYAYQEHNRAVDNRPTIQAFATSHIPSPWMGDRGVFQVMPSPLREPPVGREQRALGFDHDHEEARAHRYRVELDGGVTAEMTAGEFALAWRFSGTRSVVLDHHGTVLAATSRLRDGVAVVEAHLDDRPGTPPHFVHLQVHGALADRTEHVDGHLGGWIETDGDPEVLLGISTVSFEDAAANTGAAGSYAEMLDRATDLWTEKLATVEVEGASEDQLTSLYSGLYRLFLSPNRAGETALTGRPRYRSFSGDVLAEPIRDEPGPEIVEAQVSTTNGFWDTYRTAWPLLGLLTPSTAGSLAQGFVQHHLDGGWTPRWSAPGAEDCMTGTTSDTVFGDLAVKGVDECDGFDLETAYRSALRNATVPPRDERVGRKGLRQQAFRGFVDVDTDEGMSWTLDAAINDWSISVLAGVLADRAAAAADATGGGSASTSADGTASRVARLRAEQEWFARRSLQYRNVFDRGRGFFIGRTADGDWRVGEEFDPADWGDDYTETNAWGTMFTVPHDVAGLVDLHGGEERFVAALERFFDTPETGSTARAGSYGRPIHEMTEARDIRMGMLGLSNQPAHHIPFMPMAVGRHDDAHRIVRECVERLFVGSDLGQGYPGDEDNGEMSAWYVFASIGLYPLAPSTGTYVLVPPSVRKSTLHLPGGTTSVIETAAGSAGPYVASVTVDGAPWESISIPHAVVAGGAHIVFTLSDTPTGWASDTRPVSASDLHGYRDTPDDVLPAGSSPLTDDVGETVVALAAGQSVELPVPAVQAALYTVTVETPGSFAWDVELVDDAGAVVARAEESAAEFLWVGQTRVFPVSGALAGGAFRFTARTDVRVTQLELVAVSRRIS